jgi:hypothetical protein
VWPGGRLANLAASLSLLIIRLSLELVPWPTGDGTSVWVQYTHAHMRTKDYEMQHRAHSTQPTAYSFYQALFNTPAHLGTSRWVTTNAHSYFSVTITAGSSSFFCPMISLLVPDICGWYFIAGPLPEYATSDLGNSSTTRTKIITAEGSPPVGYAGIKETPDWDGNCMVIHSDGSVIGGHYSTILSFGSFLPLGYPFLLTGKNLPLQFF